MDEIAKTPENSFYNPQNKPSFFPADESVISRYDNQQILWHDIDVYDSTHPDDDKYALTCDIKENGCITNEMFREVDAFRHST